MPTPNREVDVDFLVFVERYATDLLKWDILTFFGQHPEACVSMPALARKIGRNVPAIRPEVGDLVLLGILEQGRAEADSEFTYQLTQDLQLRQMTIKFSSKQSST
jgi:hypothetical protein